MLLLLSILIVIYNNKETSAAIGHKIKNTISDSVGAITNKAKSTFKSSV
jgi:hypothetical protein